MGNFRFAALVVGLVLTLLLLAGTSDALRSKGRRQLSGGEYDVIIVGLGLTMTSALQPLVEANPNLRFAIIEKGEIATGRLGATQPAPPSSFNPGEPQPGKPRLTESDIPGFYSSMAFNGTFDSRWADKLTGWTFQGIGVGGNGLFNGAWTQFPSPDSLKDWPQPWRYDDLLAAFHGSLGRLEQEGRCTLRPAPSADGKEYLSGPFAAMAKAMGGSGVPQGNLVNLEPMNGTGYFGRPSVLADTDDGTRCLAGGALKWLIDGNGNVRLRNVDLLTGTSAEKLLFSGAATEPSGVLCKNKTGGATFEVRLTPQSGRIVLSAGALATPTLLYKSGVGPRSQQQHVFPNSQPFSVDVPGMGRIRDHVGSSVAIECDDYKGTTFDPMELNADLVEEYVTRRSGPYAQYGPTFAFYKSVNASGDAVPIEFFANPWGLGGPSLTPKPWRGPQTFALLALNMMPVAEDWLVVDGNGQSVQYPELYFPGTPAGQKDVSAVAQAMAELFEVMKHTMPQCRIAFGPGAGPFTSLDPTNPADVMKYVMNWGPYEGLYFSHLIINHFVGTVPLMKSPQQGGAVDPHTLEVRGLNRVHVLDASLIPNQVDAHPMGLLLAMGLQGAQILNSQLG